MPPNAKPLSAQSMDSIPTNTDHPTMLGSERSVTYAVNYSIPSVEAFVLPFGKPDCPVNSTTDFTSAQNSGKAGEPVGQEQERSEKGASDNEDNKKTTIEGTPQSVRKSQRQPKPRRKLLRPDQMEKSKVRYDINLVPTVKKNAEFVNLWRHVNIFHTREEAKQRAHRPKKCNQVKFHSLERETKSKTATMGPFAGDETVIWIPSTREEWDDCLSELSAVCKSAAFRKYVAGQDSQAGSKPFYAPLSKDYIRDRIDIDDPLIGYQFRHKTGGWLQGFSMFTNFTTWSHYFKWDSLHQLSGVPTSPGNFEVDSDGSLAAELEKQERSGDPLAGGVVFPSIAEISLVGGLGCGELLLRMTLDDILTREQYKYVVLQATDSSRTFYEKFGFIRVGAVSRYGPKGKGRRPIYYSPELSDVVGYRHWTYAHESEKSLGKHGGPSYMMALRLDRPGSLQRTSGLFLEAMKAFAVTEKPKVRQLGAAPSPLVRKGSFSARQSPSSDLASVKELPLFVDTVPFAKKVPGKKKRRQSVTSQASVTHNAGSSAEECKPPAKRSRVSSDKTSYQLMEQREALLAPPKPGESLTYAQKQYQSIWLAVPPKTEKLSRRPPRARRPVESIPKRRRSLEGPGMAEAANNTDDDSSSHENRKELATCHTPISDSSGSQTRSLEAAAVVETADVPMIRHMDEKTSFYQGNKENVSRPNLKKQKVPAVPKSLPKDLYFFNKVVKRKDTIDDQFFYVQNFEVKTMTIKLLPLYLDGVFNGTSQGRRRWRAQVNRKYVIGKAKDYKIVGSRPMAKTKFVASESWDILED